MDKKLLECGHRQPVKDGAGATWCPIDNDMALVVEAPPSPPRPTTPAPVSRGTEVALAVVRH